MSHPHPQCPECDGTVTLAGDVRLSEIVECPSCRSELEVVTKDPPVLAKAPEPGEDWGE